MTWEQIGTVEMLRTRVYPIDPQGGDHVLSTSVLVEPGVYPVYRKFDAICWVMTGRINERNAKIGDGLFSLGNGDAPTGPEVTFPSQTYGLEQFAQFLEDEICRPGPEQRLNFNVEVK